jgi:MFS family permease
MLFPAARLGRHFFVPAAFGRLGVAMSGLAVFWAVQGSSGSLSHGGVATGAFAVAEALTGPHVARLVDRWGQRRVVPVTTAVFAAAVVALVMACAGPSAGWVPIVLAAAAGASLPPVGALSAARWRKVAGPIGLLPAALSLEAAVNDVAFLAGPVLVTTLASFVAPWFGLVPAVVLVTAGTFGLLTSAASEPVPGGPSHGALMDRRLLRRGFLTLLAANLALGFFFGGIGVAITGFTLAHGAGALAGPITAVAGAVSLVAGLAYGSLGVPRPAAVMRGAGIVLAAGCALLALTPGVAAIFAGYALIGGCVALVLVPGAVLLQETIVAEVNTQAMTWVNSASALGVAVAAPLIGAVVQRYGWPAGFLALAALTALLPLLAGGLRRTPVAGPRLAGGLR